MAKLIIGCVILAIAGIAIWMVESKSDAPATTSAPSTAPTTASSSFTPPPPPPPQVSAAPSTSTAPSVTPKPEVSLASPRDVVASQMSLLAANRDDELRNTFVASLRDQVSPTAIAACKRTVVGKSVRPDWEVAESSIENGQRVVRVSMFGKSMTGFHEEKPGIWLADAIWCLPRVP